jgi:type I restriction enzyme M protein
MKNLNNTNSNHLVEVENRLEQLYHFFRTSSLKREEYFVALYLLYIYHKREDIMVVVNSSNSNILVTLEDLENNSPTIDTEAAKKLHNIFKPILEKLGQHGLQIAIDILSNISHDVLRENFSQIFDKLLNRISKLQGRLSNEFVLSEDLSSFMCNLITLPKASKIYNPFAGTGSFGVLFKNGQDYLGQEINYITWAVGTLRLIANERKGNTSFLLGDSINDWNPTTVYKHKNLKDFFTNPPEKEKFDLIISAPPFGLKIGNLEPKFNKNLVLKNAEHFLISNGVDSLKENGKLVALISNGFLFRSSSELTERKFLIDNDLIETIVSFPAGLMQSSGINFSIILINKNKTQKGRIKFVFAESFISKDRREFKFDFQSLIKIINQNVLHDSINIIQTDVIQESNYNLNPERYRPLDLIEKTDDFETIKISEIVEIIKGSPSNSTKEAALVKISNLANSIAKVKLETNKLDILELNKGYKLISESCILVALVGDKLKATYFQFENIPIQVGPSILAIKIVNHKISLNYFLFELHSVFFGRQFKRLSNGGVIKSITLSDFLNSKVKLLSKEIQLNSIFSTNEILNENDGLTSISINAIVEQNNYLRHTLAGPISNLKGTFKNLNDIIQNKLKVMMPEVLNSKISELHKFTFADYLLQIENDIQAINTIIGKQIRVEDNILNQELKPLDIIAFIQEFINRLNENPNGNIEFELQIDEESLNDEKGEVLNPLILANEELLTNVLNNLIDNAVKHAFTPENKNRIEVFVSKDDSFINNGINIAVANNGNPLPENFTEQAFFQKGISMGENSGSGFGGWYINEAVKKMNGVIEIIDETKPYIHGLMLQDLSTTFELHFPILVSE